MSFKVSDKANSKDLGGLKDIKLLEGGYSRKVFVRLKKLLSHNPLNHDLDPQKHRKLVCEFTQGSKKSVLNYLSYFLTNLGFQLLRKEQEEYLFRYFFTRNVSLHLTVFESFNKFTLRSHIDVGIHQKVIRNRVTTVIFSELRALLNRVFPHGIAYVKYMVPLEDKQEPKVSKVSFLVGDLDKEVITRFNKILHLVISSATEESKRENKPITEERMKSLFGELVTANLNLQIASNRVINKVEQLIQQNLNHALEIVQKNFQKPDEPIEQVPKDDIAFIRHLKSLYKYIDVYTENVSKELKMARSSKYKSRPKSTKENKNYESQISYKDSIQKYTHNFCHTQLRKLLLQNDLTFEESEQQLRCIFKNFLKTVSSNSKSIYEESFLFFSHERFQE